MTNRNVQTKLRNRYAAALTIAATGVLALPMASAGASPVPEPTPRTSSASVGVADSLHQLQQAYRTAPFEQKLRIHAEIVLVLNAGAAAQ